MNNTIEKDARLTDKLMLSEPEMCNYVSLGRNKARDLMKEIGAIRKIGGRVLYHRPTIDNYFKKKEGVANESL